MFLPPFDGCGDKGNQYFVFGLICYFYHLSHAVMYAGNYTMEFILSNETKVLASDVCILLHVRTYL